MPTLKGDWRAFLLGGTSEFDRQTLQWVLMSVAGIGEDQIMFLNGTLATRDKRRGGRSLFDPFETLAVYGLDWFLSTVFPLAAATRTS